MGSKSKKNTDVVVKKKPAVKKTETKKMTYLEMVIDVIAAMKDRTGSSRKAIVKRIIETHKIEEAKVVHIRKAIATGLEKGLLKQARPTGKGAGSFRVVKIEKPKVKKPVAKKIVKASSAGASSTKILKKNLQKKTIKKIAKAPVKGKDQKVVPKKIAKKAGVKATDKSAAKAILKVAAKKATEKKSATKKAVKPAAAGKKAKK